MPPTKEPSLHGLSDPPPPEVLTEAERGRLSDRALLEHAYELAAGIAHRLELVYTRVNDMFVTFVRLDAVVRELQHTVHDLEEEHKTTRAMVARESTRVDDLIAAVNESPAVRDVMTTGEFDEKKLAELVEKATRAVKEKEELERYREAEKEAERRRQEKRSWFRWGGRKVFGPVLAVAGVVLSACLSWGASSCLHKVPLFPQGQPASFGATDAGRP